MDKEGPWTIYMTNVSFKLIESDIEDYYKVLLSGRILKSMKSNNRPKESLCSALMISKIARKSWRKAKSPLKTE
jgi:hypothetical protein